MPEATRSYANIEFLQGADYVLVITMDSGTAFTNKTYRATVVRDASGTDFTGSTSTGKLEITETETSNVGQVITAGGGSSTPTITVKFYGTVTDDLPDDFEGYWDLVEKDVSSTTAGHAAIYTRQMEGDVVVRNMATAPF
jgi:hypothetical protein